MEFKMTFIPQKESATVALEPCSLSQC